MMKIIGALGAISIGLLVVFYYLVAERQESKQEIRAEATYIKKESKQMDRRIIKSKYFMAKDFGNKEEAEYYKEELEKLDNEIAAIKKEEDEEKKKREEIRKATEEFYKDTKQVVQDTNDSIKDEDSFYAKYKKKNNMEGGE